MMTELPRGTVTFLFTDIEGSTRLLHELGDAYADALADHRRVLREAFARNGGVEVDTQGDAFFVAFAKASDALAAAREAQEVLTAGPIRVRMGLHTGEPLVTDVDYVGMDVHRAARIAAAGHGGQILVSQSTRDLAGPVGFRDLGEHRLKDLESPERIYQLGDGQFPALKSLTAPSLPLPAEPLIGRKKELADALALILRDGVRLVTVTGPGGVGKTRYATALATELVKDFPDGVNFVSVASVGEPELVLPTIAGRLGAKTELADHIGDRAVLVLLDNVEHVVAAAPDLSSLLSRCPNLVLLVTSRERLRIEGERQLRLGPLPESPAVELFRQRAVATDPDFDASYEQLAALCDRLDGLPLAIELAAARVDLLTVAAITLRVGRGLELLTSGRRDVPERQRTVRATIEWSYELLAADERLVFARLGVFPGSFDLGAAEDVCWASLDVLQSLVDKNLIRRQGDRFTMLETIREYALDQLEAHGEAANLRDRHAQHFLTLAERAESEWEGQHSTWIERLDSDYDNLRAALTWASASGHVELELRLVGALRHFWAIRGLLAEGRSWSEGALARSSGERPDLQAKVLRVASGLASLQGDNERAKALGAERLALARASGDEQAVGESLLFLGTVAAEVGDYARARSLYEESRELFRALGSPLHLAVTLEDLADVAVLEGHFSRAEAYLDESMSLFGPARSEGGMAHCYLIKGQLALRAGRPEEAPAALAKSLRLFATLRHEAGVAAALHGFAAAAVQRRDFERAARLLGAAEHLLSGTGASLGALDREIHEPTHEAVWRELREERLAAGRAEGRAMSLDEAVEYAVGSVD
jgi:predicted ATPase/class 3 adenylate cyclase